MKFLLYLFFLFSLALFSVQATKSPAKKELLFESFCHAILHNDVSKITELLHQHEREIASFINDPNSYSAIQSTALHYAAFAGNQRLIELLIAHGADPFKKNNESFSAFDYAKQNHSSKALLNAIAKVKHLSESEKSLIAHTQGISNQKEAFLLLVIAFTLFYFYSFVNASFGST